MTWKGIVSHAGYATIAARHASDSAPQPSSSGSGRREAVAGMAHGLDRPRGAELLPEPADADVDDVRAGIEAVTPHLREQSLAADDLAGVRDEVVEQPELAVREIGRRAAGGRTAPRHVELQLTDTQERGVAAVALVTKVNANAGHELVEREGLREVVGGAEVEAAQPRRQVRAR